MCAGAWPTCRTVLSSAAIESIMTRNTPLNVLFLCTGNSCRSQMAEGFARTLGGDRLRVQSAGIEAHGRNALAIAVMEESGIDIQGQESTRLEQPMLDAADLVVTVCGDADEHCPILPPGKRKVHWPLPDPARATGTEQEVMKQFRAVRDDIRQRVESLLNDELEGGRA